MQDMTIPDDGKKDAFTEGDDVYIIRRHAAHSRQTDSEEVKVSIKNSVYKSKDEIFEGKSIRRTPAPQVRDSALIHTNLKSKKTMGASKNTKDEQDKADQDAESSNPQNKRERSIAQKDDISWI